LKESIKRREGDAIMRRTKEQRFEGRLNRLTSLARKAAEARDKLYDALERAKERRDWEEFCAATGVAPDADASDWMA